MDVQNVDKNYLKNFSLQDTIPINRARVDAEDWKAG